MPAKVQLFSGPACCGKTQRLLELYRQQLNGPQIGACYWLGPNQNAVSQLQESLLDRSKGEEANTPLLQPNLFTFASFAESIIAETLSIGSGRRIRSISRSQKRRLLQHIIQTAVKQRKLEHFAHVASTPGFLQQVDDFIAELKRADLWPEAFDKWCQQRPRSDRRHREFSHLYTAYQNWLHQGELYDGEGRFWAAREILKKSAKTTPHLYDLVVVNGFNDFTTAQYDILRLLGGCCSRLLISLTCETASDGEGPLLFARPIRTLARLRETFPQLEIGSLPAPPLSNHSPSPHSLRQMQNQLFRVGEVSKAESGRGKAESGEDQPIEGVEILAANSERGEIEAIAERIKALLLSGRAKPQAIVVVCRGGESSAALIDAVFPDFGIPYASELRPRLETQPLVRALFSLLRLHQEDWPFQTLLEVTNNRLFTKFDEGMEAATSFAMQPRVALERCLRSAQLPSGMAALLDLLEYRRDVAATEESSGSDQRGSQVSIALVELRRLEALLEALPAEAPIDTWAQALEQLLAQFGTLTSTAQATVVWNQLRRSLREMAQVDAWSQTKEHSFTLSAMQELLVSVAHEQRMPATHDAVGRVRILSAESARKLSTKHLFLTGLSEQSFSSAGSSDFSVAASDKTQSLPEDLPKELQETLASADVGRSEAMLLFYELVTRPTEGLTLSYPALDSKGQPLSPSPLLTDLERSAGEGRIARTTMALGQRVESTATPHSVGNFRRQAVDQALAGKQGWLAGMISQPDSVRTGSSILGGIECVAARGVREHYGPYEGLLLSERARAALARRYDAKHLWSPSRLEGYAACPFRYFAEQLLGLEPLDELTLRNDPRRRGSLLHQVLAEIHEQLCVEQSCETASDADAPELVQRFLATLDAAVKASPLRGISQSLREIERREIEAWAPGYAKQEANYRSQWNHLDEPPRPAHFEVRFGSETRHSEEEVADRASTSVPFELDLGDEKICLTGAIDRVDIGRVGGVTVFNIIDYKSGKAVKLSLDKVCSGHQLQLPLYALAAEQLLLADQGAVALATGYWNIQGSGFVSKRGGTLKLRELDDQTLKTSDDWKKLQPAIMARVQKIIASIRDGQFPVYNEDEHCTRSCSLSTVCRVAQIRSLEKVWPAEDNDKTKRHRPNNR